MQARLDTRLEQRLALAPQMLRSIEVLQLAADELCTLIDREVEANETLLSRCKPPSTRGEAPSERVLDVAAPPPDLRTWLQLQLAWRECPSALATKVLELADLLDERGLLPHTDAELEVALGPDVWLEALAVLQTLEPRGVGARTAVGAMLLQLDAGDPDSDDIAVLLTEHLDALARNHTSQVAKAMDLSTVDVERLLERVRSLSQRPAENMRHDTALVQRIELEARLEGGEVVVRSRGGDVPDLSVDPRYAALARSADDEVRRYLRPKLAAARGFIRAVDMRRRTLLRVAAAVLERQMAFLEHGVRQMRALRMAEIATVLGCHTSTISRAIAGKWVATAHGAFPLRAFFDGAHLAAAVPGAPVPTVLGQRGVQERIRELIADEDPARPLSDLEIGALLHSEGIDVARRTIAKYRSDLGLPSQWQRRSPSS